MNQQEREQMDLVCRRLRRMAAAGLTHWYAGVLWGMRERPKRNHERAGY